MGIALRAATESEIGELGALGGYVYGGAFGDGPENTIAASVRAEWTLCAFDGAKLVSSYSAFPFTMRANGKATSLAGVSTVGTLPEYRRRGLVRRILTRAFQDMRERGQPVSALWASQAAIYQRYGYAMATVLRSYSVDTVDIAFHDGDEGAGRVERLDAAAGYAHCKGVYQAFIERRMGYLHRARALWLNNALEERAADGPIHVALSRDAAGAPDGYAVYTLRGDRVDHASRGQEIVVRDAAWLSADAYRSLWTFFKRHDLVGRVRWQGAPLDDPAPELFLEPRLLHTRDEEGIWLRVMDVAAALAARGWSADGVATLTVLPDPLTPWNDGAYRIEAANGEAQVTPLPAGAGTDATLSIKALAALYAGRRSARQLCAWGLLLAAPKAAQALDALFATHHAPHCPDHF